RTALALFKRHMAQEVLALARAASEAARAGAPRVALAAQARAESPLAAHLRFARTATTSAAPLMGRPLPIDSTAVTVTLSDSGVALITLCDRQGKNTFTDELVDGVAKAFAAVQRESGCKAVVLTGYDNYFSCGGTRESLLAIQSGRSRFTDIGIYSLPSEVPVPVIAALQGHGIGAGWSLGMFCDVTIHSEKHTYLSPYMRYGFTPGAGSTLVFPERFGVDLGREILFTAHEYSGSELRARGAPVDIVPAAQVLPLALALAEQLARLDRASLEAIKGASVARVRERRERAFAQEQAMHQVCFVGNEEVLARIDRHFNDGWAAEGAAAEATQDTVTQPGADLDELLAPLRTMLAEELFMPADEIGDEQKFIDIGVDSITGVNWVRKINDRYGLSVNATAIYSHPTLREFGRYVQKAALKEGKRQGSVEAPAAAPSAPQPNRPAPVLLQTITSASFARPEPEPIPAPIQARVAEPVQPAPATRTLPKIAVIGMSGQFPKARNLAEFWRNLAEGRDCIDEVPAERWDVARHVEDDREAPGKSYSRWMGALDDVAQFDPLFFNISPREAEWMDPQQRLFLQSAWHCVEDAGYSPAALAGSKCGVFVGCAAGDYSQEIAREQLNAQNFMGRAISILAAKIAYVLDLQGPCLSIDTACSSSLVVLAAACDSLALGSSDMALAGGVCVLAGPDMHIMTSKSGMLSADGRCFTFDQRANGFVPGEGVGVVMLKRLEDAERDGDHVVGVISGWGVNQDGKTNGMTAPNPKSQARLEQDVYRKFGINPATIELVEAHGTGTRLGDPIEVEGLKEAFAAFTDKTGFCALGSVKSNIGHTLAAAGIAGAIKLLLALKHEQMPPTLHVDQVNEHIELEGSPFYIGSRGQHWPQRPGRIRRSAVSSFGFSGTNAHVVIEEYAAPARAARTPARPVAVLLSARNDARLDAQVRQLLDFLRQDGSAGVDLGDLAYTLQVGREPMEARLGIEASSLDELRARLDAALTGTPAEGVVRGRVQRGDDVAAPFGGRAAMQDMLRQWAGQRQWLRVLALWVRGAPFDWAAQYQAGAARRVSLPGYPFDQKRYWLAPAAASAPARATQDGPGMLHPLLHENTSNLATQLRYSSRFTGREFFFAQHLILGRKVLPGVGHLEMVRAAMRQACGSAAETRVLRIKNVVWMRPIACHEGTDPNQRTVIHIGLAREDNDEVAFTIFSGGERADQPVVVHSQGVAVLDALDARDLIAKIDLATVGAQCPGAPIDAAGHFDAMVARGADLGRGFRGIGHYLLGQTPDGVPQVLADITIPDGLSDAVDRFVLHPTAMDAAVHTAPPLMPGWEDPSRTALALPFALAELEVLGSCQEEMYALARPAAGAAPGSLKYDIDLCDTAGMVCVRFKGFAFRVVEQAPEGTGRERPAAAPAKHDVLAFAPAWTAGAPEAHAARAARRLVVLCGLGDAAPFAGLLDAELRCLDAPAADFGAAAAAALALVQQVLKERIGADAQGTTLVQLLAADPQLAAL
ncbi:MAG: beta-ketoacyl synthase N-terminal-like domain-containing protein, partial [Gammaproteobacteria bacterium]